MGNFRAYPGLFVRSENDFKELKKGETYQILNTPGRSCYFLTFVGLKGRYNQGPELKLTPVYESEIDTLHQKAKE